MVRRGANPGAMILTVLAFLAAVATACEGPRRGLLGGIRGRSQVLDELGAARAEEEAAYGASSEAAGEEPSDPGPTAIKAFPLLYSERDGGRRALEVLWPFFEAGSARAPRRAGNGPPAGAGELRYFRLRPFVFADDLAGSSRTILFPFYYRIREELEAGDREIHHLWPLYGRHEEWIDLAPATTHHVLFPFFHVRTGPGRWRVSAFPLFFASKGYMDRGVWLLPIIKAGTQGQNSFFYLLEPLFAYEKLSIARTPDEDRPELGRSRWSILGGLLAWENERGRRSLRLLWFLRVP